MNLEIEAQGLLLPHFSRTDGIDSGRKEALPKPKLSVEASR